MKKILAFTTAVIFVGVITLSILAFNDGNPGKKKAETTTTEQCENHQEAKSDTTGTKTCCKQSAYKGSAGCQKSAECKHHRKESADAK